jgi:hypothetical protein
MKTATLGKIGGFAALCYEGGGRLPAVHIRILSSPEHNL